ncbi:MAG: porin family protein [Desulfomicrobium sp.]|nr:porin family protein [Desulfomicrobium sp.]
MKKVCVLLLFVAFVCTSTFAIAGQTGVYIAPKFIYSYQRIDNAELKGSITGIGSESFGLSSDKDSSFGGALAIGYNFQPNYDVPIRTEIEYAMRSESEGKYSDAYYDGPVLVKLSGSMKFDVQSVFLNLYYDIDTGTKFTPYIGGGLGVAIIDTKGNLKVTEDGVTEFDNSASNSETNFAFNLAAGVGYDVSDNFTLDLGYRYADFGEGETGNVIDVSNVSLKGEARIVAHEVLFGLRYEF